jgi:hypothetical protein
MNTSERRRFHRIHFNAQATLHMEEGTVETAIIDCSLKGVLVKRLPDWQPRIGDPIRLEWKLSASDEETIRMDTEAGRISDDDIGLICNHIDLDSIMRLRRLVELNLGDTELLERDLEHLVRN